uniref:ankyrin repeat domain-containing protein 50-like n=1 Tax=Pristiophorus japonicus TaxID=55135 RepID=UPI00398F895E
MTQSLLQGKPFYCREWALRKLQHCLDCCPGGRGSGVLVTGGPGSGKTALCSEVLWPVSEHGQRFDLSARAVGHHFCQAQDVRTLSVRAFVLSLVGQIKRCSLVQGYREKLREVSVQAVLEANECERNPDETFKRAVLLPLLDIQPPSQNLLLLVDSIDEGEIFKDVDWKPSGKSGTIGELLSNHHELFPSWLLLVCSARKQNKVVSRMFTGFRKICLDDLRKSHIVKDVQQYILCRLDQEEALRHHLTRETAEMLNQLHIKSNGCFLYLERVLDGVLESFIVLREIRDIPGTLNGLYLWLCQRLFTRKQFTKIQPILNVILAAHRPLTPRELFEAVWTKCTSLTVADFQHKMEMVSKLLLDGECGTRILFHHSFAEWLLDVKYCTQKYLCNSAQGHGMLAMSLTCRARELSPAQVQEYALHLVHSRLQTEPCRLALWMVWSGAPVSRDSLTSILPVEQEVLQLLVKAGAYVTDQECEDSSGVIHRALEREDSIRMLLENGASVHQRDSSGRTLLASAAYSGNLEVVNLLLSRDADLETEDHQGQTPLTLAARMGHTKVLHCLISHDANINHADQEGWTALRSAAWGGHSEAVTALLDSGGAEVDSTDTDHRTALRAAAWGGHEDIALTLLRHGAEVNKVDTDGRTALIAAAYMGHREMVEILLDYGADINHRDADGRSALSVAALCVPASRGYANVVSLLIEQGAEVGHRDRDGLTPLLVAAYEGHADVVDLLLEGGADVDEADATGRTPLLAAASMGHVAVVNALLFWGAAVDTIDGEGRTVLSIAAAHGNAEVVQTLLDRGLDENHRDDTGWTPLHMASFEGHCSVCLALIEQGARVTEVDNDGRIPVVLAAQEGHCPCVQALLEYKSPVDSKGYDGRTTLCTAALEGHKEVVKLLLSKGAGVDVKDADGRPLLYLLALDNQMDMVQLLLDQGAANLESRDLDGRTVLHVCSWQGSLELVKLLVKYGAEVNALDNDRRSALHSAAWQGHSPVVRFLIESRAPVDHACNQGATGLCIAAQEGHAEVVRILLEKGADPNHADQYGRTPMRVAAKRGRTKIMKLLEKFGAPVFNGYVAPASGQKGELHISTMKTLSSGTSNSSGSPSTMGGEMHSSNRTASDRKHLGATSSPSESPDSTVDHRKSLMSSNSLKSSKNSSILTSSTYHSLATAQTVPIDSLTFTQQIQQHSLPRSRSRHSILTSPSSTLIKPKAGTQTSAISEAARSPSRQGGTTPLSSPVLGLELADTSPKGKKRPAVKVGLTSVPEQIPKAESAKRSWEIASPLIMSLGNDQSPVDRETSRFTWCRDNQTEFEEKHNGILSKSQYRGHGSPKYSPQKLSSTSAVAKVMMEPLIAITTLDPELNLKQAIKLQFEGPTSGFNYKKETPL